VVGPQFWDAKPVSWGLLKRRPDAPSCVPAAPFLCSGRLHGAIVGILDAGLFTVRINRR
jgi:hypothetical protein